MDQHVLQGMITRRWRSDETTVYKWTKWTSLERDMYIFSGVSWSNVQRSGRLTFERPVYACKQIVKCFDKLLEVYVHWYDNNELSHHEGISNWVEEREANQSIKYKSNFSNDEKIQRLDRKLN